MNKEKVFYPILITLLIISIVGIPVIRYAIYLAPVIGFMIMLVSSDVSIRIKRPLFPFVLLLITVTFSVYQADYHWAKQAYFVLAYTSIFLFFDFSKNSPDIRVLNLFIVIVFVLHGFLSGELLSFVIQKISLIDSKSALESTLAFPVGMFAVYFLYKKRYGWFLFNLIIAILAFKRIALLGILVCVLLYFLPKRVRSLFLNPYLITAIMLIGIVIQIEIAAGTYNDLISSTFGVSAGQLLMGRQQIWSRAISFADFDYLSYLFFGLGHGVLTGFLEGSYSAKNVLLHSDILLLSLEHGFVFLLIFSFLLNNHKLHLHRALSLYLTVLALSDNILIYQHVMIPYLLLMTVDASQDKKQALKRKIVPVDRLLRTTVK